MLAYLLLGQAYSQTQEKIRIVDKTKEEKYYTFLLSEKVTRQAVRFKNRYGITLAADFYLPKNHDGKPLAAIAISEPFGAVKEQASGLYAQKMAEGGLLRWRLILPTPEEAGGSPAM